MFSWARVHTLPGSKHPSILGAGFCSQVCFVFFLIKSGDFESQLEPYLSVVDGIWGLNGIWCKHEQKQAANKAVSIQHCCCAFPPAKLMLLFLDH